MTYRVPTRKETATVRRLATHVEWCRRELARHAGELPGPAPALSVADLQCIATEASRRAFVVAIASQVK